MASTVFRRCLSCAPEAALSAKMVGAIAGSSFIRKMFEEGARLKKILGEDKVFDFSIGNPDVQPPEQFSRELKRQVENSRIPMFHGYMPNVGYPETRRAVADQLTKEQGVKLAMENVVMTCGAAGALNVVMKSIINPGEEVIFNTPYFVEYDSYATNHGGVPRRVKTAADFQLDLKAIDDAINPRTKAIIINCPNNPTGQIYSKRMLMDLGDLLEQASRRIGHTIYLLSDEPYKKIVYDGHEVPPLMPCYKNSILLYSYAKDLPIPGERLGYIAVNPEAEHGAMLQSILAIANRCLGFVNAPGLIQRVMANCQGITADLSPYTVRKQLFEDVLNKAGYEYFRPKGAFYMWIKSPISDDRKFIDMLKKYNVLCVPGSNFQGPGWFRAAFCVPNKSIINSVEGFEKAKTDALRL